MYSKWKSRIINNTIIFVTGMLCSFVIFSFVINDSIITANIGDALITDDNNAKSHFILSLDESNILSLESAINIASGTGKSLRVSLLYNDTLKDMIGEALKSSYDFSFIDKNNSLTLLIDMNRQNIEQGKKIFSLSLANIGSQDIPIIDSVRLFDGNQVDLLSVENIISSSSHH